MREPEFLPGWYLESRRRHRRRVRAGLWVALLLQSVDATATLGSLSVSAFHRGVIGGANVAPAGLPAMGRRQHGMNRQSRGVAEPIDGVGTPAAA